MTFAIILAVIAGVLAGCSVMPAVFIENTGPVLTAGLCLLLFLVGIDIGGHDTDEKIPVQLFLEDIEKVLANGV